MPSHGYLELYVLKNTSENSLKLRLPSRNRKRGPETGQCIREIHLPLAPLLLVSQEKAAIGSHCRGACWVLDSFGYNAKEHHGQTVHQKDRRSNPAHLS